MILDEIEAGVVLAEKLSVLIPLWIARAREAGELTAEQEAAYQKRQAAVFSQPYAKVQAEELPPPTTLQAPVPNG